MMQQHDAIFMAIMEAGNSLAQIKEAFNRRYGNSAEKEIHVLDLMIRGIEGINNFYTRRETNETSRAA